MTKALEIHPEKWVFLVDFHVPASDVKDTCCLLAGSSPVRAAMQDSDPCSHPLPAPAQSKREGGQSGRVTHSFAPPGGANIQGVIFPAWNGDCLRAGACNRSQDGMLLKIKFTYYSSEFLCHYFVPFKNWVFFFLFPQFLKSRTEVKRSKAMG